MKTKFCPKCGNTDLVLEAGGGIGIYRCKKCGFSGGIFPEINKLSKKEMKEKLNKKICPKCKSDNIGIAGGPLKTYQPGYIDPNIETGIANECKDCGYRGNFPELTKLKKTKKIRRINKKI